MNAWVARFAFLVPLCAGAGCGSSEADVEQASQALETFPNEQPAFDFFRGKGLSGPQAAGIVGNLDVESGVDPTIASPGGSGRGIAQWQVGGRWDTTHNDNVLDFAAERAESATSLNLQLEFIWYELDTFSAYGLAQLQATSSASAAATTFAAKFEGCGSCDTSKRIAYAESVLERFGDTPIGSSSSSSSGSGAEPCTVDETGILGECLPTADCAALGNHESTPGYCPGASDIQCCTALPGSPQPGGGSSSSSSGAKAGGDDDDSDDDSGTAPTGQVRDEGGCSSAPGSSGGLWLVAAALMLTRRRRTAPPSP